MAMQDVSVTESVSVTVMLVPITVEIATVAGEVAVVVKQDKELEPDGLLQTETRSVLKTR